MRRGVQDRCGITRIINQQKREFSGKAVRILGLRCGTNRAIHCEAVEQSVVGEALA
jgi:hypothetical protein